MELHTSAASSSCHAAVFVACSVLGHKLKSLPLKLFSGLFLGVLALEELLIILIHHLCVTALISQLLPVLVQVFQVVFLSVDRVPDLDDNGKNHENARDSEADADSHDIAALELSRITIAAFSNAEFIGKAFV